LDQNYEKFERLIKGWLYDHNFQNNNFDREFQKYIAQSWHDFTHKLDKEHLGGCSPTEYRDNVIALRLDLLTNNKFYRKVQQSINSIRDRNFSKSNIHIPLLFLAIMDKEYHGVFEKIDTFCQKNEPIKKFFKRSLRDQLYDLGINLGFLEFDQKSQCYLTSENIFDAKENEEKFKNRFPELKEILEIIFKEQEAAKVEISYQHADSNKENFTSSHASRDTGLSFITPAWNGEFEPIKIKTNKAFLLKIHEKVIMWNATLLQVTEHGCRQTNDLRYNEHRQILYMPGYDQDNNLKYMVEREAGKYSGFFILLTSTDTTLDKFLFNRETEANSIITPQGLKQLFNKFLSAEHHKLIAIYTEFI